MPNLQPHSLAGGAERVSPPAPHDSPRHALALTDVVRGMASLSWVRSLAEDVAAARLTITECLRPECQDRSSEFLQTLLEARRAHREMVADTQRLALSGSASEMSGAVGPRLLAILPTLLAFRQLLQPALADEVTMGFSLLEAAAARRPTGLDDLMLSLQEAKAPPRVRHAATLIPELLLFPPVPAPRGPSIPSPAPKATTNMPTVGAPVLSELEQRVLDGYERVRRRLIDLGLRNPLLNYLGRGIEIPGARGAEIFERLVRNERSMSFGDVSVSAPSENRLDTAYDEEELKERLLRVSTTAKNDLQEKGMHSLYLAIGMIVWKEPGNGGKERRAPLLLVPVELTRTSVQESFRLRARADDLEGNLAAQARLFSDYGIVLPDLPDADTLDVEAFFGATEQAIGSNPNVRLDRTGAAVACFSSSKFRMYRDLDPDAWPEGAKPWQNPILQWIFGGLPAEDRQLVPEGKRLEDVLDIEALHHVLDADSSQVEAQIVGDASVVSHTVGPAGTGKTQKLANVHATSLAEREPRLFVAKKLAALKVELARLSQVGLDVACLELHSDKTPKAEVVAAIRNAVALGQPQEPDRAATVAELRRVRTALNTYCDALRTPVGSRGVTPYQAFEQLLAIGKEGPVGTELPAEALRSLDAAALERLLPLADELSAILHAEGVPEQNLFYGAKRMTSTPEGELELERSLQRAEQDARAADAAVLTLAEALRIPPPATEAAANALLSAVKHLLAAPDHRGVNLRHPTAWTTLRYELEPMLAAGRRGQEIRSSASAGAHASAFERDVTSARAAVDALKQPGLRFVGLRALLNGWKMRSLAAGGFRALRSLEAQDALLKAVEEWQSSRTIWQRQAPLWREVFTTHWPAPEARDNVRWEVVLGVGGWAHALYTKYEREPFFVSLMDTLADSARLETVRAAFASCEAALATYQASRQDVLGQRLQLTDARSAELFLSRSYTAQAEQLAVWQRGLPELRKLEAFNRCAAKVDASGVSFLAQRAEHWHAAPGELRVAVQRGWLRGVVEEALRARPTLLQFNAATHEQLIQRFQTLDRQLQAENSASIACGVWRSSQLSDVGGRVGILADELRKSRGHRPTRQLLDLAGEAVLRIKPLFMMSPEAVARFLPRRVMFNDLDMDEASQLTLDEALPAIMRAKKLHLSGDTKQLTPTRFFARADAEEGGDEGSDDQAIAAAEDSILDVAERLGATSRMLRFAYRFQHESLIATSDRLFYNGALQIFPSPDHGRQEFGLKFHHLPDTAYEGGSEASRTNPKEAVAVADAVLAHAQQCISTGNHRSLGVVALSESQMRVILRDVERLRRAHPECEPFFEQLNGGEFFVKNLENVQGDERDVIFISIGYGWDTPDDQGKRRFRKLFGPINNERGENRLNVVFSRARQRCEVWANFTPEELTRSDGESDGLRVLRHFLAAARDGTLPELPQASGAQSRVSAFSSVVKAELERRGHRLAVHLEEGDSGVDLAIVDPQNPHRYALGIMLDGERYQNARFARDRDRIKEEMLRRLGWNVQRVWITDWMRNSERVVQCIEAALQRGPEPTEPPGVRRAIQRMKGSGGTLPGAQLDAYCMADLRVNLGRDPSAELRRLVSEVVRTESPVHVDEVSRRIRESWNKSTDAFRTAIDDAISAEVRARRCTRRDDFLYAPGEKGAVLPRRRTEFPNHARRIALVAPEELDAAIVHAATAGLGIREGEIAVAVCVKIFGFASVPKDGDERIAERVGELRRVGQLCLVGDHLVGSQATKQ